MVESTRSSKEAEPFSQLMSNEKELSLGEVRSRSFDVAVKSSGDYVAAV